MLRRSLLLFLLPLLVLLTPIVPRTHAQRPPLVAMQAGHWQTEAYPEEFFWLRTSTGAVAGGVREVDLNIDIAHRIAEYLRSWGNEAYVLPATVPPSYRADAFVAIHSDGHANREARGFKVATYWRDWVATDTLVREIVDEYGRQTGLPEDWRITTNMRGYYAFNSGLYEHTIAEETPGAIIEMGFLSNAIDRRFMIGNRDLVARAIAQGIARFLAARPADGWPAPPLLPRGDIVEVLHNRVPLYPGPSAEGAHVDLADRRERYAVMERRTGWARLFFYSGKEAWIQDWQTKQLVVP